MTDTLPSGATEKARRIDASLTYESNPQKRDELIATLAKRLEEADAVIRPFAMERCTYDFGRQDDENAVMVHPPRAGKSQPVIRLEVGDIQRARRWMEGK